MLESLSRDDLVSVFSTVEKPVERFRIGAESEKFGVHRTTMAPLTYEGPFSVSAVIESLCTDFGWQASAEREGGPILGAKRGGASITLEPGAQLELSGDALPDLHQVASEAHLHLTEIAPVSRALDIAWLGTGFHPTAQLSDLPWVPKLRYPIMRRYLPQKGKAGLDMMQRTCTTQGNFDFKSEQDAMLKMKVALKLSPLIQAWFSNAPFKQGDSAGPLSHRAIVWQNMDPSRSGLIQSLWESPHVGYEDYIEWALDAGMFLFRRGDDLIENTGQTFREFMARGFEGHQATVDDFRLHLTTLFPEVRLKNTLEVRSVDALPPQLAMASLALWTGVLYDDQALVGVSELLEKWTFREVEGARPAFCERALAVELCGREAFDWAADVLLLAEAGLHRRAKCEFHAQGLDEAVYLEPARRILEERMVPAQTAREVYRQTSSFVTATEIALPSIR